MRSHPAFADRIVRKEHRLGAFVLKALTIADQDRDYAFVMESEAEILEAFPNQTWPKGLTREANLIDLAWHQKEFDLRRSFAWVIEDRDGNYLGCAYVYPSITGEPFAEITWWWRTGIDVDRDEFSEVFLGWLKGPDWPPLEHRIME